VESVYLSDPILDFYKKIPGATYHPGDYEVNGQKYSVIFDNSTVEAWGHRARHARSAAGDMAVQTFDTVVFMNALLYSQNAIHVVSFA
jgi:hypothetical protein